MSVILIPNLKLSCHEGLGTQNRNLSKRQAWSLQLLTAIEFPFLVAWTCQHFISHLFQATVLQ